MAKFLDTLPVPSDQQSASLHRSLACGLVSQAASSLQDYLETNSSDSKANAETFVAQAKKELDTAVKLEAKAVIATQQPEPAEPQPSPQDQPAESAPGGEFGQYLGLP